MTQWYVEETYRPRSLYSRCHCSIYARQDKDGNKLMALCCSRRTGFFHILRNGYTYLASDFPNSMGSTAIEASCTKSISAIALDGELRVGHKREMPTIRAQIWPRSSHTEAMRDNSMAAEGISDPNFMKKYFGEHLELLQRVAYTLNRLDQFKKYRNVSYTWYASYIAHISGHSFSLVVNIAQAKNPVCKRIGEHVLKIPRKYWDLVNEEVKLETDTLVESVKNFHKEIEEIAERGEISSSPDTRSLIVQWFEPLANRIRSEQLKVLANVKSMTRNSLFPQKGPTEMLFLSIKADKLAAITINAVLGIVQESKSLRQVPKRQKSIHILQLPSSDKAVNVASNIGRNVQLEAIAAQEMETELSGENLIKHEAVIEKELLSKAPSYFGVKKKKTRYLSKLVHEGEEIFLGSSSQSEDAARIVDCGLIILYGDEAPRRGLNFPLSDYYSAREVLAAMSIDDFAASMRKRRIYYGVRFFSPTAWRVFVRGINNRYKQVYVATCRSDEEAARVYDQAAIIAMRMGAQQSESRSSRKAIKLNFPAKDYDLDQLSSMSLDDLIVRLEKSEGEVIGKALDLESDSLNLGIDDDLKPKKLQYHVINEYLSRLRVGNARDHQKRIAMLQYLNNAKDWTSRDTVRLGSLLLMFALDSLRIKCVASEYVNGSITVLESFNACKVQDGYVQSNIFRDMKFPEEYQSSSEKLSFPAFFHGVGNVITSNSVQKIGVLWVHPAVLSIIARNRELMETSHIRCKPMIIPPIDWTEPSIGGYLILRNFIIKDKPGTSLQSILAERTNEKKNKILKLRGPVANLYDMERSMATVYQALNAIGQVPWQINKKILQVMESLWQQGGGVAGLPSGHDLPVPEVEHWKGIPRDQLSAAQKKEFAMMTREKIRIMRSNANLHSLRCDTKIKMDIAKKFQEYSELFFPHNMDFRGRTYPIHPHLNHLGSDLCRGLLRFAVGKPLGPNGAHWLKIHLANLYGNGVDKFVLEDRENWVEEQLEKIRDSVHYPLTGSLFWQGAESPFQFLAAATDLVEALESPNPESFLSRIPVHQDGSCNGLQHYAALGRDSFGGMQVNLVPSTKPSDIYTGLATIIKNLVEKDMKDEKLSRIACLVYDQIDRKLVKQTVMTSVYGVTFIGARRQIQNRLRERAWKNEDVDLQSHASFYLAKVTLGALEEMFATARKVQSWLGECAKVISSSGHPVSWTTPLGMPVVQPYFQARMTSVNTVLQTFLVAKTNCSQPVNKIKQRNAFPPNYIHSLDSSHLMLTAIGCHERGILFAGVHDSYWTHAGSVEEMNVILREKFIELHQRPLLEELRDTFVKLHPKLEFPPIPEQGTLDIQQIINSTYFFA